MRNYESTPDLTSQMAFSLKDGSTLLISKEDCKKIALSICVDGLLNVNSQIKEFMEEKSDLAIGIKQIQLILEKYPDMDKDKRNEFFDVMIGLIKKYTNS